MVEMDKIRHLSERIAREFHPERIILFGSYAYGTPSNDSDVDLLVILPFEGKPTRKALEILNKMNPGISLDLLVRTPEQVQERLSNRDWFICEIIEKGLTLYESNHN
jgi:predicted nucleotidyltransferase